MYIYIGEGTPHLGGGIKERGGTAASLLQFRSLKHESGRPLSYTCNEHKCQRVGAMEIGD